MQKTRYLFVGGINTIFGYITGLFIYEAMSGFLNLIILLIISNIISISFSFTTYKVFVFKSPGNWLAEYLRCYLVYGISAMINMGITIVMVKFIQIEFWMAQAIAILVIVIFSYYSHAIFTFKMIKK